MHLSSSLTLYLLLLGRTAEGENLFFSSSSDDGQNSYLRGRNLEEVTTTFSVTDDVFVRDTGPDRNYDHTTNLGVGYGATSNERITYVKFPIAFDLKNAASISSASVNLRVNQAPSVGVPINFFPCDTEDWSESVITWNDRPTYDNSTTPLTTRTVVPGDAGTWLSFDLTAAVIAAAAEEGRTSLSLVIEPERDPSSSHVMKFDSQEDVNNVPFLEVTYEPSQGTSPPTAAASQSPTINLGQQNYDQLVSLAADGSLQYVPYANEINVLEGSTANAAAVNTVPDYSVVGYKGGGVPIPFLEVKQTLSPSANTADDRRADIQAAIDAVAALPLDADGFRGAVLLEAGVYSVGAPGLQVYDSGIVIRGQGQGETGGTKIVFTSTETDSYAVTLGFTNGGLDNVEPGDVTYPITDSYVPVGSKSFTLSDASSFAVGETIVIQLQPNDDWILHMSDMGQWGWTPASYSITWRRVVTAVNGNELTVDNPIVQAIEDVYGGAIVYQYELLYREESVEIENVGIENIRIESIFASETDENHGKHAVRVQRVNDGWIRQLTARHFWSGAVLLRRSSHDVTVEDSASVDPKGTLGGGRRYGFVIDDGSSILVHRCYVRDGRHDYASSSRTAGPNVFVDSLSVDSYNDIGPHERFSTGQLYDNIKTNMNPLDDNDNGGEMNVQNRGSSGSGHGWAGVQIMFWNSEATRWRAHAANGAMSWAIGMIGEKGGFLSNRIPEPDGIIQSHGTHVTPRSLYYTQLKDRLGVNALHSVVVPAQNEGTIWNNLGAWQGDGLFGDAVVAWVDEDAVPVSTGVSVDIGGMVRDLNLLGNSPTYTWSLASGDGSASFGDSSLLETTASFDTPGLYSLELLVNDGTTSEVASVEVSVVGTSLTQKPSSSPSAMPSSIPSKSPTPGPAPEPSTSPSSMPSSIPSKSPTPGPTPEPSSSPSAAP
eukprot:CAMPEP_0117014640 /NCGR_PEP_ID=MMETSP0472-20121206/11839_1 /TAXON_ID=693140 ORGANISM="Tiarina fusus, Strain LIS" /NCGR_SAMPLE_ID=MMETSP0472 /ASSEMBLY_ACC=CAM_ASM_000603 /LENGTH=940 /DNA_ID=CAMNT_0004718249 /DNA_START=59 /DNA_END=2877 /DNA_ORIENTATION=-